MTNTTNTTRKYDVYWDVTVDGEVRTIKLIGGWQSALTDPTEVAIEVDSDADLTGEDFEGYPKDTAGLDIVWEGYPRVVPA